MELFTRATELETMHIEVKLTEQISLVWHVMTHENIMDFDDMVVHAVNMQYISRRTGIDQWPLMPVVNFCAEKPRAFHASLSAFAQILYQHHGKNRVYEGDRDITVDVRGILQSVAKLYSVDPNDVAKFYPEARIWLGHRLLSHPLTLDELIGNLRRAGKVEVKA